MQQEVKVKISADSANFTQNINQANTQISGFANSISSIKFTNLIILANQVIPRLASGFIEFGRNAIEINANLESLELKLTGLISANTQNITTTGEMVSITEKWSIASAQASQILSDLTATARATGTSASDMSNAFSMFYATASNQGSITQIKDAFESVAYAVQVSGKNMGDLVPMFDSLASGTVVAGSEMGAFMRIIGLTNEELKQANENGKVLDLLTEKTAKFKELSSMSGGSYQSVLSQYKAELQDLTAELGKPIFETFKRGLSDTTNLIRENKGAIIEFGNDAFKATQMLGSGLILIANGVKEGAISAVLAVANAINAMNDKINSVINAILEKAESAVNAINGFFGGGSVSFGRVSAGIMDLSGLEASYAKAVEDTNLVAKSIKEQFIDIGKNSYELKPKLEIKPQVELKSADTPQKALEVKQPKISRSGGGSRATLRDTQNLYKQQLQKAVEYYDAIGDLENKRLKERELHSIKLKELGLNELQISQNLAKLDKENHAKDLKERLEKEIEYYEAVENEAMAHIARLQIKEAEQRAKGRSDQEVANMVYGEKERKSNYNSLNSAMGYDMGASGTAIDRLNTISTFYDQEEARINAHYALLENTQANSLARQAELDRAYFAMRTSQAGTAFDAMGSLAKAFYDMSGGQNKTALRAYQAMMIGKAIINTYTAASNAYASAGNPYLGAAMAAIAIAQGMAQVAQIKAQKFHTGGFIGGEPLKRDEVPAILQTGEYVLSRKQVAQMSEAPNSNAGAGEPNIVIINSVDNSVMEAWANSRGGAKVIKNVIKG
ncbi:hypothetical protein OFO10_06010 [Campylobacter sp. VBCF_06 NA8]|uniref:hypothetical protein n=1 Tax=Campylobacter sp. VBCF_06 NA8 TaxID=2983822 RepID=UPI0022E9EE91|nr:hypothetical protein [Campylobacter sp. VBCF_06 NA8]MDA3046709.1 hypothetical protein [Campylobacter sp. VBCF_06 NA8]